MSQQRRVTFIIGANYQNFKRGLTSAERRFEQFGRNAQRIGGRLQRSVTLPIIAIGAASLRAFTIQEDAERKLRASLQANGREVDRLYRRYVDFSKEMQRLTVVGDETTLAMLQQAESMGLTGDAAERAVRNSIAMQSAFGVNADRAMRYTAALEDGNATMLNRYIPTLRNITDESERASEAQRILNNAFEVSKEEAQTTGGQLKQLRNIIGDFSEVLGESVSNNLLPFISRIRDSAEEMSNLNPAIFDNYVAYGLVAAAIGPVIFLVGGLARNVAILIKGVKTLSTLLFANPWAAAAIGVAALAARIFHLNRQARILTETIEDALDITPTGTQEELEQIARAIGSVEQKLEDTRRLHGSMNVEGTRAAKEQIKNLEDERESLVAIREQISLIMMDRQRQARVDEQASAAAAEGTLDLARAIDRVSVAAAQRVEIIEPEELLRIRLLKEEYREFDDILHGVMTADLPDIADKLFPPGSLGFAEQALMNLQHRLRGATDPEEIAEIRRQMDIYTDQIRHAGGETEQTSQSMQNFGNVGAQVFDRLVFGAERLSGILRSIARQLAVRGVASFLTAALTGGTFSLGSVFAGFFADGGTLRPGQWGIVGERGPEAIQVQPSGAVITSNRASFGSGSAASTRSRSQKITVVGSLVGRGKDLLAIVEEAKRGNR